MRQNNNKIISQLWKTDPVLEIRFSVASGKKLSYNLKKNRIEEKREHGTRIKKIFKDKTKNKSGFSWHQYSDICPDGNYKNAGLVYGQWGQLYTVYTGRTVL